MASDDRTNQPKSGFIQSTHGMMLLGVPNLGLRQEQLRKLVSGRPNELLINDLVVDIEGEPSPYLKELTQKFVRCSRMQCPTFEIISYYERKTSSTLKVSNTYSYYDHVTHVVTCRSCRMESSRRVGLQLSWLHRIQPPESVWKTISTSTCPSTRTTRGS